VSDQTLEIFYNSLPSPIGILAIQACERDAAHLIACCGGFRSSPDDNKEIPDPEEFCVGGALDKAFVLYLRKSNRYWVCQT
jgi:hypothetical protein